MCSYLVLSRLHSSRPRSTPGWAHFDVFVIVSPSCRCLSSWLPSTGSVILPTARASMSCLTEACFAGVSAGGCAEALDRVRAALAAAAQRPAGTVCHSILSVSSCLACLCCLRFEPSAASRVASLRYSPRLVRSRSLCGLRVNGVAAPFLAPFIRGSPACCSRSMQVDRRYKRFDLPDGLYMPTKLNGEADDRALTVAFAMCCCACASSCLVAVLSVT